MGSTKSGPSAAWFDKFWPKRKPIWGKWANNYDVAQLQSTGLDKFMKL